MQEHFEKRICHNELEFDRYFIEKTNELKYNVTFKATKQSLIFKKDDDSGDWELADKNLNIANDLKRGINIAIQKNENE